MLFPVLILLRSAPCSLGSSAWYFLGSLLILFFDLSASSVLFLRLVFLLGFSLWPLLLRGPPFDSLSLCSLRSLAWESESLLLVSLAMA